MAVVTMAAAPAFAEGKAINIEPQSLASALREFASQSQQAILVSPALADGKSSQGVHDATNAELALAQLLRGTGLTYRRSGDALLIVRASDPQSGSAAGDGADGTVQALIVTAQKREEDIQDVPIAMSAFTQEDLTRSQVAGGPDLMTQVPNMTFTKTNFTGYSIQIRGIGTQAISATTDPGVAVAFNNNPFIRNHFFEQEFYDLERVEVLRGPQGTLYGRNATAGVVNIISAKPKNTFAAKIAADVANYGSMRLEGMINIPLVDDKAALRIAGAWTKRDGFVKNILSGEQTDGRDLWSGRVTLGITPTDTFTANLIYEHFEENDDRLRSGKQLCHKDLGPAEVNGIPVNPGPGGPFDQMAVGFFSQGCLPASLYSPDSFQTPNGYTLPFYGAVGALGSPVYGTLDPYVSATQSRNLREIETHLKPEYEASADVVELQLSWDVSDKLTLASETGFSHDYIFSFEDYNRFDTPPGVFVPGARVNPPRYDIVDQNGVFCDPQLGCTDRLALGDLSTAKSLQFSQEFRLSSAFDGPVNFNVGANFLRYDTEDKYYVFVNSLTVWSATSLTVSDLLWIPGVSDNSIWYYADPHHAYRDAFGFAWTKPAGSAGLGTFGYIDPNNIHNLNDLGRNYFVSKNPYHLLSYAAFGELYWQVTPTLKVTGGLRFTVDKKTAPLIPSWLLAGGTYGTPTRKVIEQEWREPTGRLAIDWKPKLTFTDETLLYASYVRGYKAGGANPSLPVYLFTGVSGFNPASFVAQSLTHPETFEPEFVNAYEVGAKNTLLDGRLTLNLNAFHYDYTGYQISEIVDRSALNRNFDAKIWGAELEADWRPLENLRLGFKGGYEDTRVADGSKVIDLMDRTAGDPNYIIRKPFPTFPSNCIVPVTAPTTGCEVYKNDAFNTPGTPNNGEGIEKDLSGNALPNAPKFTSTITADYTLPLPREWLVTLHTDLYYQSEAWTRIINTPGYDKLKAYSNINLAAIFSNEDPGWQVMAYIKNVLDKDNITGAFLNSDDTGLTTNVFLNEPRLYGLRVTKNWGGSGFIGDWLDRKSAWQPLHVEVNGAYDIFSHDNQHFRLATMDYFNSDFPMPKSPQGDLDWGSEGGVKLTYQPAPGSWSVNAGVRYGRAGGDAFANAKQIPDMGCAPFGDYVLCFNPINGYIIKDGEEWLTYTGAHQRVGDISRGKYNFYDATATNEESHVMADFMLGKDVGIGGRLVSSTLSGGLSYAQINSVSAAILHVRPDFFAPPDNVIKYDTHVHRAEGEMWAHRKFQGAGPSLAWNGALALLGEADQAGRLDLDLGLQGSVLFGKQTTRIRDHRQGRYTGGSAADSGGWSANNLTPPYSNTFYRNRTDSVTVPALQANVGLAWTLGNLKLSGGYRFERYFNAIDGGIEEHREEDRDTNGAYFKVAIGFGG